jgi:hypothetical protein
MKPVNFKESHLSLTKPDSMTDEECGSLPIHRTNDGQCISCWVTTSFWQRINVLFHGTIWVGVHSGQTQPPIWIDCTKTVFVKQ